MSLRTVLVISYFAVSLALIIWSEIVSRTQSELGIFGMSLFGVITFPSSYLVGSIASMLGSSFWPTAPHLVESRIVTGLILIAGYFQWFHLVPGFFRRFGRCFDIDCSGDSSLTLTSEFSCK